MKTIVAAFLFLEDKVLLIKHKRKNTWLPVGGHVEDGESFSSALLREIKEEVHLSDVKLMYSPTLSADPHKSSEPLPFYTGKINGEALFEYVGTIFTTTIIIQEEEILDFKFFTLEEVERSDEIKEIVKKKVVLAKEFLLRNTLP